MKISDPMSDTEGYLTPEKFEYLLRFTDSERNKVLFRFIFYTGRRVSEVVRCLTPKDFNFKDNMVFFKILKRRIPTRKWINVSSRIMNMMRDYIVNNNIGENEFIFKIGRKRVDQIIKSIGEKAGMLYVGRKKIHTQQLRHSYAIMMSKKLKNPNIFEAQKLQKVMAHANIESTLYYIQHYNPKEMREFVEL